MATKQSSTIDAPEEKGILPPAKVIAKIGEVTPFAVTGFTDLQVETEAAQGTRHTGPLLSGAFEDGLPGIAILHKRAKITFSNGTFSIPVTFPAGAVILKLYTIKNTLYNGTTPTVSLTLTDGGTLMHAAAVALDSVSLIIETAITQLVPTNHIVWLSVAAGASTAGSAIILLQYSVPAKVVSS